MYDKIAKSYNELYKEEQLNKLNIISNILKVNRKDLLLDVGAGTGISTTYFNCKSYGIELSLNMIKNGEGNLINAQAENIPFKSNTFDVITAVTSFHNFLDFDKAILEIKRAAKPKCRIVITLLKKSKNLKLIKEKLLKNFKMKEIDEDKDLILYTN